MNPGLRRTAAAAGLAVATAAAMLDGGSLALHMAGYALTTCLAAPFLALGLPPRAVRPRPSRRLAVGAWLLLVGGTWLAHAPGALAVTRDHVLAAALVDAMLLGAAVAFWLPPLGRGAGALPPVARPLYLAAAMPALDGIAIAYMAGGHPTAGAAMLAGSIPLALATALTAWLAISAEERGRRALETAGA